MPVDTRQMREDRHKLLVDGRAILDKADEEKRDLSAEERAQYDKLWAEMETVRERIEDAERRNDLERAEQEDRNRAKEAEERAGAEKRDTETRVLDDFGEELSEEQRTRQTKVYHHGFLKRLVGRGSLSEEEQRAQLAGKGEKGGYLYASQVFIDELIRDVTKKTIVRKVAKKTFRINADSIGAPTITSELNDAEWTSELGKPSRGKIVFGKRAITAHPLA